MGLLDDLKQQAEARKSQLAEPAMRDRTRRAVDVLLREVSHYFTELADALNVVQPPVARHFHIFQARLDGLLQCDYNARERRTSVSEEDYVEESSLRFRCVGSRSQTIEKNSPNAVKALREYLWGCGYRFETREIRNDRMMVERVVFTVLPEVSSAATFAGELDTGQIRLTLRNIESAADVIYLYQVSEVNRDLLEELTKLLLAKPNQLRKLGYYQEMMSTTTRMAVASAQERRGSPSALQSSLEPKGGRRTT